MLSHMEKFTKIVETFKKDASKCIANATSHELVLRRQQLLEHLIRTGFDMAKLLLKNEHTQMIKQNPLAIAFQFDYDHRDSDEPSTGPDDCNTNELAIFLLLLTFSSHTGLVVAYYCGIAHATFADTFDTMHRALRKIHQPAYDRIEKGHAANLPNYSSDIPPNNVFIGTNYFYKPSHTHWQCVLNTLPKFSQLITDVTLRQ